MLSYNYLFAHGSQPYYVHARCKIMMYSHITVGNVVFLHGDTLKTDYA